MLTKKCENPECVNFEIEQDIENFIKRSDKLETVYRGHCKTCTRLYMQKYREKNIEKLKQQDKEYYLKTKERRKEYNEQTKEQRKINRRNSYLRNREKEIQRAIDYQNANKEEYQKKQKKAYYDNIDIKREQAKKSIHLSATKYYYDKLKTYEECRIDPNDNNLIQVKCKNQNCSSWFNPSKSQVRNRLNAINGKRGVTFGAADYLYCSQECKDSCALYNLIHDPNNLYLKNNKSRENLQDQLRELVLERDKHTCQKCGSKENLICHHIVPYIMDKIESADMDNCITFCGKCHEWAHSLSKCKKSELAQYCKRKNKEE